MLLHYLNSFPPLLAACRMQLDFYHHQSNSKEKPQEWHIELIPSSAFFPCRLKSKSCIFLWTSEKPSEWHGTCTHSPLLSPSFERMTATSQWVKNLKPILGSPALFFFFHWEAEIRDPTDITEFTLFPLLLVLSLLLSSEGSVWPPTLCCYFQCKISIQGLLDASHCLFFTPPTWFSLNARQIEHFQNWHFSQSVCQHYAPWALES